MARATGTTARQAAEVILDDALRAGLAFAICQAKLWRITPEDDPAAIRAGRILSARLRDPVMRGLFERAVRRRLNRSGRTMLDATSCIAEVRRDDAWLSSGSPGWLQ